MTKIKNTKKGMAKKTLSMSLVVAMLATSNVPVWAAEFSDGSDDVAVATEADAFVADAPVVDDSNSVAAQTEADGVSTDANVRVKDLVIPKSVTYGDTIQATGTLVTNILGTEANYTGSWTAAWRVAGENENFWTETVNNSTWSNQIQLPTSSDTYKKYAGKTLELHFYADDDTGKFDITVGKVEVKSKDINNGYYFDFGLRNDGVYDGKEFTAADLTIKSIKKGNSIVLSTADVTKYFKITAKNAKNAGDEFIIYATAKDKLDDGSANPYSGTISQTFAIKQRPFSADDFIVKYAEGTKYEYTGKVIQPELSKITVTETKSTADNDRKLSGADVTSAIASIRAFTNADANVGKKSIDVFVDPEKLPNFSFADNQLETIDGVKLAKLSLVDAYSVVERDLTKCKLTIKDAPVLSTVINLANPASGYVTVTDENGNILKLQNGDYDLIVTDPADNYKTVNALSKVGDFKGYIVARNGNSNVKGETSAVDFKAVENVIAATTTQNVTEEYTGSEIKPDAKDFGTLKLTVSANTTSGGVQSNTYEYQPGAWEIVGYKSNTNAGTAYIVVKTKSGDFANRQFEIPFTITPLQVKAADIAVPESVVYDKSIKKVSEYGLKVTAKATSRTGKTTSIELTDKDFTASFTGNNTINTVINTSISVTNPNYIAVGNKKEVIPATKTTKIVGGLIEDSSIKLNQTSYVYTGGKIAPDFKVMIGSLELEKDTDYVIKDVENAVNVGTATLVIEGRGKYLGSTAKATFEITPANIEDISITVAGAKYRGGKQVRPDTDRVSSDSNGVLKVTLNKNDITSQFEVTAYGANNTAGKDAGSVTVQLLKTSKNFNGTTKTSNFDIKAYELTGTLHVYDKNGTEISVNNGAVVNSPFTYDGTEKTFASVKFVPTGDFANLVTSNDYEIKYVNNIYGDTNNSGSVIVVAKDGSNFAGDAKNVIKDYVNNTEIKGVVAKVDFAIGNLKFDGTNVTVKNGVYAGGLAVKPEILVQFGGKTLVEGKDYKLEIPTETEVTTKAAYNVKVFGINGYNGSVADSASNNVTEKIEKWGIDKQTISNCDVTVKDGKATVINGTVKVPESEYTVTKNDDDTYTVAAKSTSKNYTGSKTVKAEGKAEDEKPDAPMISSVKVVGNKATVILSGESEGASGYDYVISTDRDCITNKDYTSVNKNQVKTNTTFEYVGQNTYYAYCHAWKRDENGQKVFSDWSNAYPFVVSAITPSQPVITSVKASGSTVTVTYTKASNADGYDVVLGTSTKKVNGETRPVEYGTLVKKNIKGNVVTATFKNVKKGTYYAGLHAFNRTSEDGKKVFSQWSNVKKVTVK